MHDVLVVGAGPAGSWAAKRCADRGLDVLLLDAAKFPRDKACGGVVGDTAVRLIGPDVLSILEREAHTNRLFYDWKPILDVAAHMYFFKRRKFDAYLVRRAEAAGATLLEGRRVTRVDVRPDKVVAVAGGEAFGARLAVGAEGTNSVVGRAIRQSHHDGACKYASIKAEVDLTSEAIRGLGVDDPPHQNTYFLPDLVGFGWLLPNDGSVNAGYGAFVRHASGLRERFYDFLAHLGIPPNDVRGAQIPYLPTRRVYADRVMLTGDAGGFVNPWTGCGIDDGIEASERLADVAKLAADTGDFTANTLRRYQEASREQRKWIQARGRWMKALDLIMPVGKPFPRWVKYVVKATARWA